MSRFGRWRELPRVERGVLLRALWTLPCVAAGLRLFGLRRTHAWLSARACAHAGIARLAPREVARLVSIAARRGPYRAKCLPAALTLQHLLRRAGVASELRLGVRKVDGRLDAHAWIEHEGNALMEAADVHSRYAPFAESILPVAAPER
jgi:hypothetical protein